MIDLYDFYQQYEHEIQIDDLYRGYYLHLLQDAIYRKFLYYDYKYGMTGRKDPEILYNDYVILNGYVKKKYQLENRLRT